MDPPGTPSFESLFLSEGFEFKCLVPLLASSAESLFLPFCMLSVLSLLLISSFRF